MSASELRDSGRALGRLRQFVQKTRAEERCDLCGREIAADHDHLIEPAERRIVCACGACAVLFSGQAGTRFRRVPKRVRLLSDFAISDGQWDALRLPINLAFFFRSSPQDRMLACYPSPAGATESLLSLDAWDEVVRANPILAEMEPDVEALLVNRVGHARGASAADYLLVPMDECYRLVGLIRMRWTGLSGGNEVWREIARFFAELQQRAVRVSEASHA